MENDSNNDLPPKLAHAFKQLRPKSVFVPRSVDDAVLDAARRRLRRPAPFRWVAGWSMWVKGPVLAAACLVLALVARSIVQPGGGRFVREDLNRDRQVDILDAFELARRVRAGAAPDGLDLNGDGVVDRIDAEIIARQAVRLEKGGRS